MGLKEHFIMFESHGWSSGLLLEQKNLPCTELFKAKNQYERDRASLLMQQPNRTCKNSPREIATGKIWLEAMKKLVDTVIIIRMTEICRNRRWWDSARLQVISVKFLGIFLNVNKYVLGGFFLRQNGCVDRPLTHL